MAPLAATRLTYEDFVLFPDDGRRHEIIDGEHYVNAAPIPDHQRVLRALYFALHVYLTDSKLGEVLASPIDVVLSESDVVEPDLIVVLAARAHVIGPRNVQGPPDVVVEVLSESTRQYDEAVKRKLYDRAGVGEHWIADPAARTVKIYRRAGAAFAPAELLTGGAVTSPLLPDFALDLAAIFAGTPRS